jgi:hypothetical protein
MSRIFPRPETDVSGFTIQCTLCLPGQPKAKSLIGPIVTESQIQRLLLNVLTQRKRSWLVILRYAFEISFDPSTILPEDFCHCSQADSMIIPGNNALIRPRPTRYFSHNERNYPLYVLFGIS